jgi:hypothetical protein
MGNRFDYHVSFRVTHPTLDAGAIAAQLRMTPKFCWTSGEPRKTPRGTPLQGVREESYCTFDIGSGDDGEIARCLSTALEGLRAEAEFLRHLRDAGGSLMFYVYWYPNGDTGELFATDLLRDMAEMGIELGINVYDDRPSD